MIDSMNKGSAGPQKNGQGGLSSLFMNNQAASPLMGSMAPVGPVAAPQRPTLAPPPPPPAKPAGPDMSNFANMYKLMQQGDALRTRSMQPLSGQMYQSPVARRQAAAGLRSEAEGLNTQRAAVGLPNVEIARKLGFVNPRGGR